MFTTKPAISVNDVVHIVIYRATYDATNYLAWGVDSDGGYAGGNRHYSADGSTWGSSTHDHNFKQYYNAVAATGSGAMLLMGVGA